MNLPIATELSQIVRVVYSSLLATVVFSVVFALAVAGFGRESEMRRAGRVGHANAYRWIALSCLALCGAAVVYGVILVGQKS
jgi:cytochrome bd-type quinol oxidase subunit 2